MTLEMVGTLASGTQYVTDGERIIVLHSDGCVSSPDMTAESWLGWNKGSINPASGPPTPETVALVEQFLAGQ